MPAADGVWIFGPTAGGKSALALALAEACIKQGRRPVILNADASQRYADLAILTARPSQAELVRVPHALYGTLGANAPASVGSWLTEMVPALNAARKQGHLPVLVGGTGLYLRSLLHGIAALPPVPEEIRQMLRTELARFGLPALYAELQSHDPVLAARLPPGDTQRILRGLEIFRATGKPLSAWHREPVTQPLPGWDWHGLRLLPPRDALYTRIDARAETMLAHGALEEVAALLESDLPESAPIRKTIGLPELAAHLRGETTRATALAQLQQSTRRYAKRQITWARHQLA